MRVTLNDNKGLWKYQSRFLRDRSFVVYDYYGNEHFFCNPSAVLYYLARNAMWPPVMGDEEKERESLYLVSLISQMVGTPGMEIHYYGHRATLTNRPYQRVLGDSPEDHQIFALVKRLNDIPILCKMDFDGLNHVLHTPSPACFGVDNGLAYWCADIDDDPDHDAHTILADGRYAHGDIVITGIADDGSGILTDFDLHTYLQGSKLIGNVFVPFPTFVPCKNLLDKYQTSDWASMYHGERGGAHEHGRVPGWGGKGYWIC